MKAPAGLLILAPQAIGASQVEQHHGSSRGHAAWVTHRNLLPCCATHTQKNNTDTVFIPA